MCLVKAVGSEGGLRVPPYKTKPAGLGAAVAASDCSEVLSVDFRIPATLSDLNLDVCSLLGGLITCRTWQLSSGAMPRAL